jgi:hypothetical protein
MAIFPSTYVGPFAALMRSQVKIYEEKSLKQLTFRIVVTAFCSLIFQTWAFAQDGMTVKWTKEVGSIVKLLRVEADEPVGGLRLVTFTYEAVKPCGQLSVYGHSYSKDDVQLPLFSLGAQKRSVTPGQKFRDQAVVTHEPGHYLLLDKAHCF